MNRDQSLPSTVLQRTAIVYVRQSTNAQVQTNLESQRRQYELVEAARRHGFKSVEVIDDDLGRSASGTVDRPGFDRLVALLCAGEVGAVLCLDASRLARNGRDWHHLLELCGLVEARVIDLDGIYNPSSPNDRLLLGMKGSISEFELNVLRVRMLDAARAKAERGDLRISVPIGYIWHREAGLDFDPNLRLQEVIRLIFARFRELGSARQTFLSLHDEQVHFPRPTDGRTLTSFDWILIRYRNVISVLKNPFYAGVYSYGKTTHKTTIVNGHARKTYKHAKPFDQWDVVIQDHHAGYITYAEFERNQRQLAANAYGRKDGGVKSGRGGRALLVGFLRCAHCGLRMSVNYSGRIPQPVYRCGPRDTVRQKCISFGARRVDAAIGAELLRIVQPLAIDAALQAEKSYMNNLNEQQRLLQMELQQAQYDASLAERRYAACEPENRLIAAQLEKHWEDALRRVQASEQRLASLRSPAVTCSEMNFEDMALDLVSVWESPDVTMRTRQQLLRAAVVDIMVEVDDNAREITLTIHWQGGQHSQVRVHKPGPGEHACTTPEEAIAIITTMAGRWSDQDIAASLNRMGLRTGQEKTWTAHRVNSIRRVRNIPGYRSADKQSDWLTMSEAAEELGVTNHVIRRLIKDSVLPAEQLVPGAPWQIRRTDLQTEAVGTALQQRRRRNRPCRDFSDGQIPLFTEVSQGGAQ